MELLNTVRPSIIKVIGVGGGGSNAVSHMHSQGIEGVDFVICNTDTQALEKSQVLHKIQLGTKLTDGLGAGNNPEKGKEAAMESVEEIRNLLSENTKMVFITAGMGGGTGTGAAPVIASIAKEMGVLTVGIVTEPFSFEGRTRVKQAEAGIEEMRKNVDSIIVICNDKLRELYGDLDFMEAFSKADDVLATAAKGIAELITVPGKVNVDFEDVKTVLKDSGKAIMGFGSAEGDKRAVKAVQQALNSELLNEEDITGASNVLLNIITGKDKIKMDEFNEVTDYVQKEAGEQANIIWGVGVDETLDSNINIVLVAAGFNSNSRINVQQKPNKKVIPLGEEIEQEEVKDASIENKINQETVTNTKNDIQDPSSEKVVIDLFSNDVIEQTSELKAETETKETEIIIKNIEEPHGNGFDNNQIIEEKNKKVGFERAEKLRELSSFFKTPESLHEFEKIPAYERKGIQLDTPTPSNETNISDSTLQKEDDNSIKISSNNSFLHDNVD